MWRTSRRQTLERPRCRTSLTSSLSIWLRRWSRISKSSSWRRTSASRNILQKNSKEMWLRRKTTRNWTLYLWIRSRIRLRCSTGRYFWKKKIVFAICSGSQRISLLFCRRIVMASKTNLWSTANISRNTVSAMAWLSKRWKIILKTPSCST